jgi:hypothetical protein
LLQDASLGEHGEDELLNRVHVLHREIAPRWWPKLTDHLYDIPDVLAVERQIVEV